MSWGAWKDFRFFEFEVYFFHIVHDLNEVLQQFDVVCTQGQEIFWMCI